MLDYFKTMALKLGTIINSRRLWLTVITIVVSLFVIYNAIAVPLGLDAIPLPDDTEQGQMVDDIMVYASAIRAILSALAVLIPSGVLVHSQAKRPSNNNDCF